MDNMNLLKIKGLIMVFLSGLMVFFVGCSEEGGGIDRGGTAPAQVTDINVYNTSGGAVLTYKLSDDKNLLYVQAEYEIRPGVKHETKASYFIDSLVLEGFGDTLTHNVKLFTVGRNEKTSEPLSVPVNPKTPPIHLATKNLRETFGGVAIDVENPERTNLAIVLMADTANVGYMSDLYTFYSSLPKATFNFRGLDSIPYSFAVYFRDRWKNLSDTLITTVKPLYEEEITKNTWREFPLPDDAPPLNTRYRVGNIWNEDLAGGNSIFFTENQPLPAMITWDFGKTVMPSRLKFWPRNHPDDLWKRGNLKVFELYGSMAPNADGSLDDSWRPIGRFECEKPTPGTFVTQEDIDAHLAGFEYDIVVDDFATNPFVPIRYMRLVVVSTYNNTSISSIGIQEISFWGTNSK